MTLHNDNVCDELRKFAKAIFFNYVFRVKLRIISKGNLDSLIALLRVEVLFFSENVTN